MIDTQEMAPCDLCGSLGFKEYWAYDDFSYVQCKNCGLIHQNPQPEPDEISNMYAEDYFDFISKNQNAFFNLMKLSLQDIDFDRITNECLNDKRILDIGCSTGLLLNHLSLEGWETVGVEICKDSAQYARDHFDLSIHDKTLFECNFPDDYFPVIHFSHVIEHVPGPADFLKEVYRILKPGGYIIVTTPNVDGLFAKIFRRNWRLAQTDHLFLFSKRNLTVLLEQCGFEILKDCSWGGIPVQMSNGKVKKITDHWIKYFNMGDVMLFLARK